MRCDYEKNIQKKISSDYSYMCSGGYILTNSVLYISGFYKI